MQTEMSPNERVRGRESAITFASSSRLSASHRWPGACASSHARYLHRHIQSNRRRSHQHLANRTEQELRSRDMNKQNKKRRAEGGGGELSPMVAAVALPGCSCCSAASSWSARAAALLVGSRREEPKRRAKPWRVRLYRGGGRGLGFIHRWDGLIRRWRSSGRSAVHSFKVAAQ